jgi:hypothetical protein
LSDVLDTRGYTGFTSGRHSSLYVPPDGFEGHLSSLPRKRRMSIAAERRKLRGADCTVAVEPLNSAAIPRFAELEAELLRKYGIDWCAE